MANQIDILLVEDNPADILLVQEALKDARIKNPVHVVSDGQTAIDFLEMKPEANPDGARIGLVLLDLVMPRVGGLEVLKHIKTSQRLKTTPVVIMTSSQEETDIAQAYELQANSYITKPVDYEQLIKVADSIKAFWLNVVQLPG